jgi:ribose transport system substrate-binding protein
LVLSGCGTQTEAGSSSHGPFEIGFVNGADTEFHTCLAKAVKRRAADNSVVLYTANSRQKAAVELSNIKEMIARHVDAIILQTVDVKALKSDIAKARAAGIAVFLTSVVPDDTADLLGAVVVDQTAVGKLDAGWVARDADGRQVSVGIVAGAPGGASDQLVAGFTKYLPDNASVVANEPGMYDAATARKVAANMIARYPGLNYVFVANEEMAFAVRKAFTAAGADGVKIVTVNGTDEGLAALKDGRISATVTNSAEQLGILAVDNTVALLRKDDRVSRIDKLPIRLITKTNTDLAPMYCPPADE